MFHHCMRDLQPDLMSKMARKCPKVSIIWGKGKDTGNDGGLCPGSHKAPDEAEGIAHRGGLDDKGKECHANLNESLYGADEDYFDRESEEEEGSDTPKDNRMENNAANNDPIVIRNPK